MGKSPILLWVACIALLFLSSCEPAHTFHFEDLGGFKLPPSFVETEFTQGGSIQILKGKMAPEDAVALVKANRLFSIDFPTNQLIIRQVQGPDMFNGYVMHKRDEERYMRFHVNIATGEVEAFVAFGR